MSRWIDADALMRYGAENQIVYSEDIDSAPSIDIVRCQDCKYWRNTDAEKIPTASIACGNMHADDFCSYGERKESE